MKLVDCSSPTTESDQLGSHSSLATFLLRHRLTTLLSQYELGRRTFGTRSQPPHSFLLSPDDICALVSSPIRPEFGKQYGCFPIPADETCSCVAPTERSVWPPVVPCVTSPTLG